MRRARRVFSRKHARGRTGTLTPIVMTHAPLNPVAILSRDAAATTITGSLISTEARSSDGGEPDNSGLPRRSQGTPSPPRAKRGDGPSNSPQVRDTPDLNRPSAGADIAWRKVSIGVVAVDAEALRR